MPLIRSLVFKCTAYCFKLIAVILLLSKVIPTYFYYTEKGLIYCYGPYKQDSTSTKRRLVLG